MLRRLLENPVFWKEVRGPLRGRKQQSLSARIVGGGIVVAIVAVLYYLVLRDAFSPKDADERVQQARYLLSTLTVGAQTTLLLFGAPSLASGMISLERERQTWNALLLSRLSASEIVVGKYAAAMLPSLALLLAFAPLDAILAAAGRQPPAAFVLAQGMLLGSALFYTALGLFCSWAKRRSFQATAAAFSVVAGLAVGTFLFYALWALAADAGGRTPEAEMFVPLWLNPYLPLWLALSAEERFYTPAIANITFCVIGTLILMTAVTRRLSRGPGELEQ